MKYISETKLWIEKLVIGYNLCPFAKVPFSKDLIRYVVCLEDSLNNFYPTFLSELQTLVESPSTKIETSILITPNCFTDFEEYLDSLDFLNEILVEAKLEGIIQIASFHPDYLFEGSGENDVSNYTNRSPYPMFHLLRESSLENVLKSSPEASDIPAQNIKTMQSLGLDKVKKILNDITGEN